MTAVEVEDAGAELGEDPLPDRVAEAGDPARAEAVEHDRIDVLEVDVGDPLAVRPERLDRVAAADEVVADVEAEPDQARIGQGGQALDLGGRLDERPGVRVEGRSMAEPDDLGERASSRSVARRVQPSSVRPRGPSRSLCPAASIRPGRRSRATTRTSPPPSWSRRSRSRQMASASSVGPSAVAGIEA